MRFLKTAAVFTYAGLSMIILTPLGLIAVLITALGFQKLMSAWVYRIARGWSLILIKLTGCPVTVSGREFIPKKGGLCFVSNHGSIFDIVILLAYAGRPIGFVAKKELSRIPLVNIWILLIGGIFIDRNSPRRALRSIAAGAARIKSGGAIIIFPEGSRSRGRGLLPFRPGAFKLATLSGAPIVPVAIEGSYEVFEKTRSVLAHPVRVSFCEPVHTTDLPADERRSVLPEQVRAVIASALTCGQ
jgi:1-acyl-sn-glycerol-3-phosphate acyltransferase